MENVKPFIKHVHVEKAGTLEKLIPEDERNLITTLVITGYINQKDFDNVIDDMCSICIDYNYEPADPEDSDDYRIDYEETPRLRELDLGGCDLVGLDALPYFGYKSILEKLVFPQNSRATAVSKWDEAFDGKCLKEIGLPSGLKVICDLGDNTQLTGVVIPDSVELILDSALADTAIETINIPAKTKLEGNPFFGCHSLKQFDLHPDNPYYTLVDGVLFTKDMKTLVSYPDGLSRESYSIPDGVEILGEHAFSCSSLKEILMPNSLKQIGDECFMLASNLQTLDFPDSIETIGFRTMAYCQSLQSVSLPANLLSLGAQSFNSCPNLHAIVFPSALKKIEYSNLVWSPALESIYLPEGLEEIYNEGRLGVMENFHSADKDGLLQSVTFPSTIKSIPSGIFHHCTALKSLDVHPDNPYFMTVNGSILTKDGKELVAVPNRNRTDYVVPNGVKSIQARVFWEFSNLKKISLPDSLTKIDLRAFDSCSSLKEITIPEHVLKIEERAFDECMKLATIKMLPKRPPKVKDDVMEFGRKHRKVNLRVPAEALAAYKEHPYWSQYNITALE